MKTKPESYTSFNERSVVLRQRRNLKMANSAHAYVSRQHAEILRMAGLQRIKRSVPEGPAGLDLR